jgi:DNA-binding NtrC family response regulator
MQTAVSMNKKVILVVEPDEALRQLYPKVFDNETLEVVTVDTLSSGLNILKSSSLVDGIIIDFNLLEQVGIKIIPNVKAMRSNLFMLLTGNVTSEKLMECVKMGIDDFIEKPFINLESLKRSVEEFLNKEQTANAEFAQTDGEQVSTESKRLVGQSKIIIDLKKLIHKVAPLDSTVLILGETGTGKEVVARMIHSLSPKSHNNFFAVNCGGIPDTLLESTLFGHEKGSFTGAYRTHKGYFEVATDGTIFLDEIGDTTQPFQVKLLRILQDRQFRRVGGTETLTSNARIIAATNKDLTRLVEQERFREDLYYRIHVIAMKIPPLRERSEDIPLLIRYFMHNFTRKYNRLGMYLKPETIQILEKQPWRGNVRELEILIERLVALSDSDWISPNELPEEFLKEPEFNFLDSSLFFNFTEAKNRFEKEYVTKLLTKAEGNITRAAKMAGIPRQNLHLKIKKHKLNIKHALE